MILSIIGGPGSGKSTQARIISKHLDIPVLEVGKELRALASKTDKTADKITAYMRTGRLVPATIMKKLFFDWIRREKVTKGFVIDGFPRRMFDLKLLHNQIFPNLPAQMLPYLGVFELNIPLEVAVERIHLRTFSSSAKQKRIDEKDQTTRFRHLLHKRNRKEIKKYYKTLNKWAEIDGTPDPRTIQKELEHKVEKRISENRDRIIMIIGAAGSGKDTQAMKLAPLGYKPFSSGAVYREEMSKNTKLGVFIRDRYMNAGKPVPNKYHFEMLKSHLDPLLYAGTKVVATGIIRKISQAEWFDRHLAKRGDVLTKVVYLKVPKKDLIERLSLRRICPKCGFNYHLKFIPPKNPGICDKDGTKLIQREDETPSAIQTRLKEQFYDVFDPIFDYYKQSGRLIVVNGKPAPGVVEKSVKMALTQS